MVKPRSYLVIAVLCACGCGANKSSARRDVVGNGGGAFVPGLYAVSFTSARLAARRTDGSPWHTKPGDNSAVIVGGLLGLAVGNPALGVELGQAASDPGGDPLAPAPYVDLKIDAATYRTSAVAPTYAPNWNQPIAIDARKSTGREHVIVQVRDAVDDSVIAQYETTLGALVSRSAQTFTDMAPVMSLDLRVASQEERKRTEYTLRVPSTMTLDSLLQSAATSWRAIPVWNGDTVTIEATGTVCPSSPSECFGPDGAQEGRWVGYSYDGFKDARHASLVAIVPGDHYRIGKQRTIKIEQSGRVLLFVNDMDVGNNTGEFEVHVAVTPKD